MAQDALAHEDPVVAAAPPPLHQLLPAAPLSSTGQMQPHAPFPSWSPYAGTAFGAHPSPAAADSRLPSEHVVVPDHAWNQRAPSSTGAHGGSGGSNFLSLLEARNVTPEMFEDVPAACDYLTRADAAAAAAAAAGDMAGAAAYGLGSINRYSAATASSPLVYSGDSVVHGSKVDLVACYEHEGAVLQQMIPTSRVEMSAPLAPGYSGFGAGSLLDAASFVDYRSAAEFVSGNNSNRHEQDIRPGMGSSSTGSGVASAGAAARKSDGRAGGKAKKSKQEPSCKASPPKAQGPKVKLGEKITALQQIVSPFGKTDTSSVLFETIKYIKFLHEQLRLFSEPYVTKSSYKGHVQLGGEEGKTGTGHELRGRGLCLVPVSLTSQVYHDDTLPDCWAPAHRSCLYP